MSNLKPKMCKWFHAPWMKVKEMRSMIVKGWDKTRIIRAFGIEFQLATLQANIVTLLFTIIQGIEDQMEKNLDVDPTFPISIIMEECL